jgi:chromate transport protein ChrA
MSQYRPIVGVGVGWLAAAVAATILAVFWPFFVLALLLLAGMLAWRWLWSTNTISHNH